MAEVLDRSGRLWKFLVDIGNLHRVKQETGENLGLPLLGEPPLILALNVDPVLASRVLWSLMRPHVEGIPKMTEELFYDIFTGQTFEDAKAALFKDLVDFFRCRNQNQIADMIEAAQRMIPAMLNQAM